MRREEQADRKPSFVLPAMRRIPRAPSSAETAAIPWRKEGDQKYRKNHRLYHKRYHGNKYKIRQQHIACDQLYNDGSQEKSSPAVYEMEKNIWDLIGQLKKEVAAENEERINALCRDIENQTAERNRRLRMEH